MPLDPILVTSDDPCLRAKALREVYRMIVAGMQQVEVSYQTLNTTRMMRYAKADIPNLQDAIRDAESECAALQGKAYGRYPIQAGARRRPGPTAGRILRPWNEH